MMLFFAISIAIFFINLHHIIITKKANTLLATIRYGQAAKEFKTHPRPISICPYIIAKTDFAYVAMLSTHFAEYGQSAIKLGHTLKRHSNIDLVLFELNGKTIPRNTRTALSLAGWIICGVQPISGPVTLPQNTNRFLQASVYSKFHAWNLVEYKAVALIDLDILALRDPSDLFTIYTPKMISENKSIGAVREHPLKPCYGNGAWNTYNAGMLLIIPNEKRFVKLVNNINIFPHDSAFDAEQALINNMFKHSMFELPVIYNALTLIKACEPDVWYNHHHNFKLIHFTVTKPWTYAMKWSQLHDPFMCWFWQVEEFCMLWDMIDEYKGI
jgi:alpha-N-acetylglucosamine transferase